MVQIHRQFSLKSFNTLAVDSSAEFFAEVTSVDELREVTHWARCKKLPLRILAGGSNVVLSDFLPGLTIKPNFRGRSITEGDDNSVLVCGGAGETWHDFVCFCLENGCFGIENLALIPGTVGAAPIQNIGAYGVELEDVFHSLKAVDLNTGEQVTLDKQQCNFSYRNSIFKHSFKDRYVITEVTLRLVRTVSINAVYPALSQALEHLSQPKPVDVFNAVVSIRKQKLPDPSTIPNVGSFFKNPIVSNDKRDLLRAQYSNLSWFEYSSTQKKIAAAWLIDTAGWKGKKYQDVAVHDQHALVLVNPKHVSSMHILNLADAIVSDVAKKFAITLEMEPVVF